LYACDVQQIELAPESVEAIALRVAELLASERAQAVTIQPVDLLPIAAPRSPDRKPGRRREDLAAGLQGTPFRRPG
jgi:hypothetical protein